METLRQQRFYEAFRNAVKKRTTSKFAVPVSGGLDSTLIVKALNDNNDLDKANFFTFGKDYYAEKVADRYAIELMCFDIPEPTEQEKLNAIFILEEPFYSHSINYYLYKRINAEGIRVSMSGLGADELFGGYDYYGTEDYPRGLLYPIEAKTDREKKIHDIDLLINHHLRENEKIGLFWEVEGRYPFLDKEVFLFNDTGKSLIKAALLEDFNEEFVNRKKTGFRIDNNKSRDHQKREYLKQYEAWKTMF